MVCLSHSDSGLLYIDILEATDIMAADSGGTSDPYVVARLNGVQFFKTKTIKKTLIPVFEETTQTQIFEKANSVLQFELFDFNVLSKNKSLGCVLIPLKDLGDSEMVIKKLPISSAPGHSKGFLSVRLFFDSRAATKKGIDMEQRAESTQGAMSKMTRGLTYSITQQIHFPKGKKTVAPRVVVGPTGTSTMQVPEIQVSADTPERDLNKRRPLAGSGGTLEALNQAQNIVDEAGPKLQEATGGEVPASELLAEAGAMTEGVDAALANIESDMVQPEVSGAASMRSVNSTHSISGHEGALATIHILGASALRAADATGLSDPYIKVQLIREGKAPKTLLKTAVCKKTLNPSWIDEKITVPLGSTLAFLILDHNNIMSSVKLGHVDVETSALFEKSDHFESAFNIENGNGTLQLTGDLAHPARASSNNSSPSSGDRLQRSGSTASMRKTAKDMFKKIAPFSKH